MSMRRQCVAVGIILLFIIMAFSPLVNANPNTTTLSSKIASKVTTVRIIVSEYRADGSIKRVPVVMSREEFMKMRGELQGTATMDEKLSVYKNHGLIPENITAEKLHQGMIEKAKKIGSLENQRNTVSFQNQDKKSSTDDPFLFTTIADYNTSVNGLGFSNLKIHVGLSAFTGYINFILIFLQRHRDELFVLPSADLLNFYVSILPVIETSKYSIECFFAAVALSGFVGYTIDFSPLVLLVEFSPLLVLLISFIPFPLYSSCSFYLGYTKSIRISYIPFPDIIH
jgi:hypothetical protein